MHLAITYLDKGGGIGQCAYELARVLARETQVTCYITESNALRPQFESLPCRVRVFPMQRGPRALLRSIITGKENSGIAKAIAEDSPDLVLDAGSLLWIQVIERQLGGRFPLAEIIHDAIPHPGPRYLMYSLHRIICPSLADVMIGMSAHGSALLQKFYPDKTHISSRHGIILPSQHIDCATVAAHRKNLLFFGQITPYKGLDILVDAYEKLKKSDDQLRLSVVGRGNIRRATLKKINALGIKLTNRYVSEDEIKQIILEHGVMVLPYTSATQSGVAAVALANGLPCVATDVGALPEQVMHERNGIIVPPKNVNALVAAIQEITSSEHRAKEMSSEAVKIAQTIYSWNNIARELLDDLQSFLQHTRAHRKQE